MSDFAIWNKLLLINRRFSLIRCIYYLFSFGMFCVADFHISNFCFISMYIFPRTRGFCRRSWSNLSKYWIVSITNIGRMCVGDSRTCRRTDRNSTDSVWKEVRWNNVFCYWHTSITDIFFSDLQTVQSRKSSVSFAGVIG